jgi:Nif11 domain
MRSHLDKFYKLATKNTSVRQQFEVLAERKDFEKLLVQLGAKWGYSFTAAEIQASIAEITAPGQGNYFCLPLGCWQKSTSM